ncbi:hypothetical protein ESP57_00345 [Agromyces fucosus]|uniref:Cytochrome P450 n=1 Tax=Agromyces fucosus TaxID=41985 RepID=A0A4Q2JSV3_9MICO|nr:hypothetical protein [Agromyces fucosus]RXZ50314.1 hypothetical protein ESP57_00345 [Agromyces fucosus]
MIDIIERAEVERILRDPESRVPSASAPITAMTAASPLGAFRAGASRFVNGAEHAARREHLDMLLDELDPNLLVAAAVARTRESAIPRDIPVAVLAEALGFARPDALPPLVEVVAAAYPTGESSDPDEADAAIIALLEASGAADADERVLRVQLLVQAHAATAALVERAIVLARSRDASVSTRALLETVLRDDSPVPLTRRIMPARPRHGETLVTLHLDGPDREATPERPARILAFGAGDRACPAPHHALAIAAAIVETTRDETTHRDADREEVPHDADAR